MAPTAPVALRCGHLVAHVNSEAAIPALVAAVSQAMSLGATGAASIAEQRPPRDAELALAAFEHAMSVARAHGHTSVASVRASLNATGRDDLARQVRSAARVRGPVAHPAAGLAESLHTALGASERPISSAKWDPSSLADDRRLRRRPSPLRIVNCYTGPARDGQRGSGPHSAAASAELCRAGQNGAEPCRTSSPLADARRRIEMMDVGLCEAQAITHRTKRQIKEQAAHDNERFEMLQDNMLKLDARLTAEVLERETTEKEPEAYLDEKFQEFAWEEASGEGSVAGEKTARSLGRARQRPRRQSCTHRYTHGQAL